MPGTRLDEQERAEAMAMCREKSVGRAAKPLRLTHRVWGSTDARRHCPTNGGPARTQRQSLYTSPVRVVSQTILKHYTLRAAVEQDVPDEIRRDFDPRHRS